MNARNPNILDLNLQDFDSTQYDAIELQELTSIDSAHLSEGIESPVKPTKPIRITLTSILGGANLEQIEATKSEFSTMTRSELATRIMRAKIQMEVAAETGGKVSVKTRLELWLCNVEFTQRGIPPVFRKLPSPSDDDPDQIADVFAIDLQWLAKRYPKNNLVFRKWQNLFNPSRFHSTSDWISSHYPRNAMHWFCKGLGMTEEQQRELHFVKRDGIRKELEHLKARQEEAKIKLSSAYRARDARYKTADSKATIERRASIWFVGMLAEWKPQRMANYYEAHTGDKITRQLAANIAAQVQRDLPESRPKPIRQRSKNAPLPSCPVSPSLTAKLWKTKCR